ncbi:MAG: hypothetical protein AMXMBFR84_21360 [Candidatus Hydrogenedentota bacterium]
MDLYMLLGEMLLVGFGAGLISNALGLGGGILMVPAFLAFVPEMDMNTAKGTSLFAIMFISSLSAWYLNRGHKDIPYRLALTLSCGSIVGAYLGGWFTSLLPEHVVTYIFIGLLGFVAVRSFFIKERKVTKEEVRKRTAAAVGIGFIAGLIGGATGTGGGVTIVPMALMAGLCINERVVALSNMVIIMTCTSGTLAHVFAPQTVHLPWTYGQVNVALAPVVFIGAVFAGWPGRRLNAWLTLRRRRIVMGTLLALITAQLVYRAMT